MSKKLLMLLLIVLAAAQLLSITASAIGPPPSAPAGVLALEYELTASAGANGSISPSGTMRVDSGSSHTFTFTPNSGYVVDTVTVDGRVHCDDRPYLASLTFSSISADHTVEVTFKSAGPHTITASAGAGGSISPAGNVPVSHNGSQTFTFTCNSGYVIDQVKVDNDVQPDSNISALTLSNVIADRTIEVTFKTATHTVTATAGAGGTVTPSGVTTVNRNANLEIEISPNTGYVVDTVTVDDVPLVNSNISAYSFINIVRDRTIHVTFKAAPKHTITATAGAGGTITPLGNTEVTQGASQTFTITPGSGYVIDSVTVDTVPLADPDISTYTFNNVASNHTIHVTFKTASHTITSSVGAGGTITPLGAKTVTRNADETFTITPNSGYVIETITVDGTDLDTTNVAAYKFKNVIRDHTIHVTFMPEGSVTTHKITASAGTGGTISPAGVTTVAVGGSQDYTFTPNTGFEIDTVTVDGIDLSPTPTAYSFTNVTANRSISVTFKSLTYTITATAGAGGSISPADVTTLTYGGRQNYTFTPDTGFDIDTVTVDGTALTPTPWSYTFTNVTANHSISVTFKAITPRITATAGPGGSISPAGVTTLAYGGSQDFTFTPDTGYSIDKVTINGLVLSPTPTSHTFTNVTSDLSISVTFKAGSPQITATAGPGGSISPAGVTSVVHGASQSYTITPNSGYVIDILTVDDLNYNNPNFSTYTFSNVTADHTIQVTFRAVSYTITATAGSGGSISPAGPVSVNRNADQAFTITPNTGYVIEKILVDSVEQSNTDVSTFTFQNVIANHTIHIVFKAAGSAASYKITATAGTGGSISPAGITTVAEGGSQKYTITPDSGYVIKELLVDGQKVTSPGTSYTFSDVKADHTIHVTFETDSSGKKVTLKLDKKLYHEDDTKFDTGAKFYVRVYDLNMNLVKRVELVANGASVSVDLQPGSRYMLVEEFFDHYGFSAFDIDGIGKKQSDTGAIAFTPTLASGATSGTIKISVINKQKTEVTDDPGETFAPPEFPDTVVTIPANLGSSNASGQDLSSTSSTSSGSDIANIPDTGRLAFGTMAMLLSIGLAAFSAIVLVKRRRARI